MDMCVQTLKKQHQKFSVEITLNMNEGSSRKKYIKLNLSQHKKARESI
jgi:hypothetical protein